MEPKQQLRLISNEKRVIIDDSASVSNVKVSIRSSEAVDIQLMEERVPSSGPDAGLAKDASHESIFV